MSRRSQRLTRYSSQGDDDGGSSSSGGSSVMGSQSTLFKDSPLRTLKKKSNNSKRLSPAPQLGPSSDAHTSYYSESVVRESYIGSPRAASIAASLTRNSLLDDPYWSEDLRVRRRRGTGGTDSSKVNGLPENKLSEDFLGSSSGYSSEDDYVGRQCPPSPGSGRRSARFSGPWEAREGALTAWESTCVWLGAAAGPPLYPSQAVGRELPVNTLDELIDQLGGPECVAEMTGRKGRVVSRPDGTVAFESRAEQGLSIDHVNLREKERFMSGEKLVAIISEASSSGVSLQADRRVQNQRRRVHMTLELPWSADRAIQQFGRTHRSNQVSAPEYIFLISELAGERRFASIVAKRLESLGALTHGDRRATESRDLSKYNFENKYGARALSCVLTTILSQTESKVPLPQGYPGGDAAFFRDMKQGLLSVGIGGRESRSGCLDVEKDCSISKFLNRILGLEVHKQNALFQYFSDTFDHLIAADKREGKYDMGILDLAPGIDEIYEESQQVFLAPGHPQDGQVVFYKISVDRGLKWEEAYARSLELTGTHDGFYLSYKVRGNKPSCLLAQQNRGKLFTVYKPNIGRQSQLESLDSLSRRFHRVTAEEAREPWESSYTFSLTHCSHTTWNRHCRLVQEGKDCTQGLRLRHHYMLCGALLRVWGRIAAVMADVTSSSYLQIVRLKTKDKKKQVGIKIPEVCVRRVLQELQLMDDDVKRKQARTRGLLAPLPTPRPLALPFGPGEVLDLTYSPPAQAFPAPSPFTFPALGPGPGSQLLGAPDTPDTPADPVALLHQGCEINFKEVLEDMLRSLNAAPPAEPPGPLGPLGPLGAGAAGAPAGGAPERQSVIQFSPPFPNS